MKEYLSAQIGWQLYWREGGSNKNDKKGGLKGIHFGLYSIYDLKLNISCKLQFMFKENYIVAYKLLLLIQKNYVDLHNYRYVSIKCV